LNQATTILSFIYLITTASTRYGKHLSILIQGLWQKGDEDTYGGIGRCWKDNSLV